MPGSVKADVGQGRSKKMGSQQPMSMWLRSKNSSKNSSKNQRCMGNSKQNGGADEGTSLV